MIGWQHINAFDATDQTQGYRKPIENVFLHLNYKKAEYTPRMNYYFPVVFIRIGSPKGNAIQILLIKSNLFMSIFQPPQTRLKPAVHFFLFFYLILFVDN